MKQKELRERFLYAAHVWMSLSERQMQNIYDGLEGVFDYV